MRRWLFLVTVVLVMAFGCSFSTFADNTLKYKWKIGRGETLYILHNGEYYNASLLYDAGRASWLQPGLGPRVIKQIGKVKPQTFGYLVCRLDTSRGHWPVGEWGPEVWVIPVLDKWTLYTYNMVKILRHDEEVSRKFWGREFIGYQIVPTLQLRLQTEWSYKKEFIQSLGIGWAQKLPNSLTFAGYLGISTREEHPKEGWLELKVKL